MSARFTLDAMPGKQMAIDADLNAGLIDDKEAKRRRSEISQEADFYGAMDGASKFVRGDAVAGILILVINVLGGSWSASCSTTWASPRRPKTTPLLTIGDGLWRPALIAGGGRAGGIAVGDEAMSAAGSSGRSSPTAGR